MVVRRNAIVLLIALASAVSGCSLPPVEADAGVQTDVAAAQTRLQLALAAAPYPLRLPATLPEGFALAHVEWIDEPNDPARHGFSFDVRYVGPDDTVVHIFQTNVSPADMGETDPVTLAGGEPLAIAGAEWTSVTLPNGDGTFNTQIARRFDGTTIDELVTLTIDARSPEWVILVAESLVEVSP